MATDFFARWDKFDAAGAERQIEETDEQEARDAADAAWRKVRKCAPKRASS